MITLHCGLNNYDLEVSDSSYRYMAIMQRPQLVLKFSLPQYIEIPIGSWCEFKGQRFYLRKPENLKKHGERNIEYDMLMGSEEDALTFYKMRNTVDKRLKYSMCAKPHEILQEIVNNLNSRDGAGAWRVGSYIDASEKTIEFNHTYILDALQSLANLFETEWEISGGVISLCKVEHFKDAPLPLSYGKGNGFMPGVGRIVEGDNMPIKRLYVQGGERNIDRSKYGAPELLLPKSQTVSYEGRTYKSDADGYYIERSDKISDAVKEDSLDCSEIYPSREGSVSSVEVMDTEKNFYDFIDKSIPETLNFNDYVIAGETATIIFQTGILAAKEFEFKYKHAERRFEIVPQEIDGVTMPNDTFKPSVGDKYAVFGIMLPSDYICNNTNKTGASWKMMNEAARYMYEHEEQKFTFTGEMQGLWAKRNWDNVGGKLVVGGYIHFTDKQFAKDGVDIRITGIKEYINNPYAPTIELSNNVSGETLHSKLKEIEDTEVVINDTEKSIIQFTKRRFRDALETIEMLDNSLLNFSHSINPIAVQTMAVLIGDESLQYRFVSSRTNLTVVHDNITYDSTVKKLHCPHGFIQHMTLGIKNISSSHKASEYKIWELNEFLSARLDTPEKRYYLYIKVSRTNLNEKGTFLLSENAIAMDDVTGYYHLLCGVLNSEFEGERSFVTMYGFTEVLPGRITTDRIVSSDGESFIDLADDMMKLGDCFSYNEDGMKQLRLKFILSENANLGGWIFRNGRLESQDGKLYLDGNKGVVNIGGIIKYATGFSGKLTDANLIWLPETTMEKVVTVLYDKEHLGKVIKCYNSNKFGGKNWRIALREYVYSASDDPESGIGHVKDTYEAIIRPQETIEIAYFERPYTGEGANGSFSGRWEIIGRFSQEIFINDQDIGRFPRMIAIGRMNYNNGNIYISGDWWDSSSISSKLSVARLDKGKYRISFANTDIPNGYKVLVSGYGSIAEGGNSVKAGVWETASTYMDIHTSDDASRNDGSFDFMIFAPKWWYNLKN